MSVVHIPLTVFTAVDLANLTEVALIFDQIPSGALFVADLEFIKSNVN